MRTLVAASLFALIVPACIVGPGEISGVGEEEMEGGENGGGGGGGSGGGSGTTLTPRITATVDKTTMPTELGKTETLTVTIQSVDGFTGSVPVTSAMMDATSALTGFTITATPPTVDLTAGGSATVQLSVKIPTDAAALAPQLKIDLGGASPASVTSDLTIANQLTLMIPAGTGAGAGAHAGLPAANAPIRLRSGASIVFRNADTIQHVIHGNGGIPHENLGAGMPGTDYKVTVMNNATWYCHSHEGDDNINRPVNVQ